MNDLGMDLLKWRKKSLRRFTRGKNACVAFEIDNIRPELYFKIRGGLLMALTRQDVGSVFDAVLDAPMNQSVGWYREEHP